MIRSFGIKNTPFYLFPKDIFFVTGSYNFIALKIIQRRYFMPNKGEIYKCELCGNIVKVLEAGGGSLVCCGEDMQLLSDEEAKAYS
jgi:desulfoferrodoxin-like iron-binding protein